MNRTRAAAGIITLVILVSVTLYLTYILIRDRQERQPQVGQRSPISSLRYCAADQVRPCVVSFQMGARGEMVMHILRARSSPKFDVLIRSAKGEQRYDCRPTTPTSDVISCRGKALPVGEQLRFALISTPEDDLLAEGAFPVIGVALATPEIVFTPTPVPFFEHPPR